MSWSAAQWFVGLGDAGWKQGLHLLLEQVSKSLEPRTLGSTGLEVTPVCVGTSPLGNTLAYKYVVPLDDALATIRRAFEGPINFLDTSNNYGDSERRIGRYCRLRAEDHRPVRADRAQSR